MQRISRRRRWFNGWCRFVDTSIILAGFCVVWILKRVSIVLWPTVYAAVILALFFFVAFRLLDAPTRESVIEEHIRMLELEAPRDECPGR